VDEIAAAGFLFDMDGTLVDSSAVVEAVWTEFGRTHDLDPAEILAFAHGRKATDTVRRFLPHLGDDERDALVRGLVAEEVGRVDGVVEIPGAARLLRTLEEQGAPVAVVTSAPRELAHVRLQAAGLRIPQVLVAAEDVEHGKPDPEGYLRAANLLGVPIRECVVFEDAEAGLGAAVASGARVVVIGDHASQTTEGLGRLTDYVGVSAVVG
jgi:mannitol-1-/sugar-/sorbitol-6-phosphatase